MCKGCLKFIFPILIHVLFYFLKCHSGFFDLQFWFFDYVFVPCHLAFFLANLLFYGLWINFSFTLEFINTTIIPRASTQASTFHFLLFSLYLLPMPDFNSCATSTATTLPLAINHKIRSPRWLESLLFLLLFSHLPFMLAIFPKFGWGTNFLELLSLLIA